MNVFRPMQATIGGLLVGIAVGMYMLVASKIAGHSGMLKALLVGPRDHSKLSYLLGLLFAGAALSAAVPNTFFEKPKEPQLSLFALGMVMGVGTYVGNGCTSGHGLCGLSRFSYRSFAAVPVFMISAILASSASTGFAIGSPAPVAAMEPGTASAVAVVVCVLAVLLVPVSLLMRKATAVYAEIVLGFWCGLCGGAGLAIGGMAQPSSVQAALSLQRTDLTLWTLFVVALVTTFSFYRLATSRGVAEACTATQGRVDGQLLLGAALFGTSWGATGACPGPLVVIVGAAPTAMGPLLILLGVAAGMLLANSVSSFRLKPPSSQTSKQLSGTILPDGPPPPSPLLAPPTAASNESFPSVAGLSEALYAGAVTIDLRNPVSSEATGGALRMLDGALSAPWDRATATMPLTALPSDKAEPIVLVCRSGTRAAKAASYLADAGYTRVLNGGGPEGPAELWQVLCERHGVLSYPATGVQWRQLFDGPPPTGTGSSTLTYLLMDEATKEVLIVDPVLEQVDRDLAAVEEMGGHLVLALNTHAHADHITGSGALKRRVPGLRSAISAASGAKADQLLAEGEEVSWAAGTRTLKVLPTPGHTTGCVSYYDAQLGVVFTGDTLLIRGCGRTDFQGGSAETLYESIHSRLFTLPSKTLVLPAHDYKGQRASTIGAEACANPRLTLGKVEFAELMANLNLTYPKKIDVALPANMLCGIQL